MKYFLTFTSGITIYCLYLYEIFLTFSCRILNFQIFVLKKNFKLTRVNPCDPRLNPFDKSTPGRV